MNDNSKYYTPTIEEFHVGFEYLIQYHKDKEILEHAVLEYLEGPLIDNGDGETPFEYALEEKRIYAKYLDREDIESLGWIKSNIHEDIHEYNDYEIHLNSMQERDGWVGVVIYDVMANSIFHGYVRNKSELLKVFEMLNINDNI